MGYNSFLSLLLLCSFFSYGKLQIHEKNVHATSSVTLSYADNIGFFCTRDNERARTVHVPSYRLEGILSQCKNENHLQKFIEQDGYIRVTQLGKDDYKLTPHTRGRGGGPILGAIFYGATKAFLWGTVICVPQLIARRRANKQQQKLINQLAQQAVRRNIAAPGAGQVSNMIVKSGQVEAGAATAASVGVASSLSGMSVAAWIETASLYAWGVGMAIFPPA
jgi:hypothetical protein